MPGPDPAFGWQQASAVLAIIVDPAILATLVARWAATINSAAFDLS